MDTLGRKTAKSLYLYIFIKKTLFFQKIYVFLNSIIRNGKFSVQASKTLINKDFSGHIGFDASVL